MTEVSGKLLADLRPTGVVRIVFVAGEGTGKEPALTVKNLDTAELEFVQTFGLTPERAAALRAQLERNKVFAVEASLDKAVATKFGRASSGSAALRIKREPIR